MITTLGDFTVVPYQIPSQVGEGAVDTVQPFIERVEEDALIALLGFPFYRALVAGLEALPDIWNEEVEYALNDLVRKGNVIYKSSISANEGNDPEENPVIWEVQPDDKWLLLLEGDTYTWEGKEYTWVGLHKAFIPMVYAEYLTSFTTFQTSVGTTAPLTENADSASPASAISKAWARYRQLVCKGLNPSCRTCNSAVDTLIGYLLANEDVFAGDVASAGWDTFKQYLNDNFKDPGSRNDFNL